MTYVRNSHTDGEHQNNPISLRSAKYFVFEVTVLCLHIIEYACQFWVRSPSCVIVDSVLTIFNNSFDQSALTESSHFQNMPRRRLDDSDEDQRVKYDCKYRR